MANKYNAFISYRHAPEDIKIASEVQKSLERFKIPPAIQQKTGVKRFERVFRDKEELPITADLNDDIDEAIKNSDNLIVICSTRTNESIWVRKEIETFLKYHTKKEIFTVLVDGEPEDVIPDILQHDTITIKKADGTTETREALIEPLSCDYRIGIKKARKVELPRLAASLLGCSYDELVQRRRQYERRRNAIIGTISTCAGLSIMAYLVWSLLQIRMNYDLAQQNYQLAQDNYMLAQTNYETAQANYQEALKNQSEFLATISGQYLENNDRVSAVLLALAALPSEGNDRPVTTRAEYALTNSLSCYYTPGAFSMLPIWQSSTSYEIDKFLITQDTSKIVAMDARGDITIWNTGDHEVYKVIPRDGAETKDFALDRDGVLIINYREKLVAYDSAYENVLWTVDLDSGHYTYYTGKSVWTITDGEEVMYTGSGHLMLLDKQTGSVKLDLDVSGALADPESVMDIFSIYEAKASRDGSLIALSVGNNYNAQKLYVYDRDADEYICMAESISDVSFMRFSEDNELFVSYQKEATDNMNFVMGDMEMMVRDVRTLSKFDPHTGKEEWEVDIPYTLAEGNTNIIFCDYTFSGEVYPAVGIIFSNKLYFYSTKDGKLLADNEMTGEAVSSYMVGDNAGIAVVLKTGKYMYATLDSEKQFMISYSYFSSGISDSNAFFSEEENDNHFLVKYSDQNGIIEYVSTYYDQNYIGIDGVEAGETIQSALCHEDKVLFFGSNMNLYCYDSSTGKIDWKTVIDGSSYTAVRLVCTAQDGMLYLINRGIISGEDRTGDKLFMVDISDGSISRVEGVPYCRSIVECCVDDKIVMGTMGDDYLPGGMYIYDCETHTSERIELNDDNSINYGIGKLSVSPDCKKAVFVANPRGYYDTETTAYLIDLESGELTEIPCMTDSFAVWDKDSKTYAIGCGAYINLYDVTDGKFQTIPRGDSEIVSMVFCDKGLITYTQVHTLTQYDLDGNMLGSIQLEGYKVPRFDEIIFKFFGEELLVSNDAYNSIIDLNDFEIRTKLYGLKCYDPEKGRFYVKTFSTINGLSNFGYYERLSIEELIERGLEYVGNETLSDEMKNLYGIT